MLRCRPIHMHHKPILFAQILHHESRKTTSGFWNPIEKDHFCLFGDFWDLSGVVEKVKCRLEGARVYGFICFIFVVNL